MTHLSLPTAGSALVTKLREGQHATILQLPVSSTKFGKADESRSSLDAAQALVGI
jgi:hypothetical protein